MLDDLSSRGLSLRSHESMILDNWTSEWRVFFGTSSDQLHEQWEGDHHVKTPGKFARLQICAIWTIRRNSMADIHLTRFMYDAQSLVHLSNVPVTGFRLHGDKR